MDWFHTLIGQSSSTIEWWQMTIRAVLIFGVAVLLIRLGGNRIFGKNTVLDIVLGVVLGSNFSRALTGNAPFIPTVVASAALVGLHAALAKIAMRKDLVSKAVKGTHQQLIKDGEVLWDNMKEAGVGTGDLEETMRLSGKKPDIDKIEDAYLERSGDISIITS